MNQAVSKLVWVGAEGDLDYALDEGGNRIPDFSRAGYQGGGVRLPEVPVLKTLSPMDGDDTQRIQEAIDRISVRPLDKDGFRGTVLLTKGIYHIEGTLS